MPRPELYVLVAPNFTFGLEVPTFTVPEPMFTPDVVVAPSTISGATFGGGTATITTSAAHNLRINMAIFIAGVVGLTGINQPFQITAVGSSTTFQVQGVFSGTYTSGGTATPQETAKTQLSSFGVALMERDMLAHDHDLGIAPPSVSRAYAY